MKNKYLVVVENLEDTNILKKMEVTKFLFPLKFFSVGFNKYFEIKDITVSNAYLYINKMLTSDELDLLRNILNILPKNIIGIVFEDLGVIQITKDMNFEKILYLSHFNTNVESIKEFLKYTTSVVIPTDLTIEEVNYILDNSYSDLCIYGYGYIPASYSKRTLNKNYSDYHKVPYKNKLELENTDFKFITVETEAGTVIYENKVFNGLHEKYRKNIKYIIVNLFNINLDDFINDLNKTENLNTNFLYKKTIYKLKAGDK